MADSFHRSTDDDGGGPGPPTNDTLIDVVQSGLAPVRVLLAEDHEIVRQGILGLINSHPRMEVVGEARNGEEACARARLLRPDIIVMDVSMPVMDGLAATAQLTSELPHVRVVVLTAHEDRGRLDRALQAGAAGYIAKRSAAVQLLRAIEVVSTSGTYIDPILAGDLLNAEINPDPDSGDLQSDVLSEREAEVFRRIAWGEGTNQIAAALHISPKTVETYRARIRAKLGVTSRTEIVRYAARMGWFDVE